MSIKHDFNQQFTLSQRSYLASLDFFTWTRHFHVLRDLIARVHGDVLEVGIGDGVVRRCIEPFVASYTSLDLNPELKPDVHADLREYQPSLAGRFDAAIATEILEHLPLGEMPRCLLNLKSYLRPGGLLFLTLPHRKGHLLVVTPQQRLLTWRFPVGMTSLSEAYNRFIRRRIWIDPNHCWEIGDGHVRQSQIKTVFHEQGWRTEKFEALPYCDYWLLRKPTV